MSVALAFDSHPCRLRVSLDAEPDYVYDVLALRVLEHPTMLPSTQVLICAYDEQGARRLKWVDIDEVKVWTA